MKELSESVEANEREQRRERHETEPLSALARGVLLPASRRHLSAPLASILVLPSNGGPCGLSFPLVPNPYTPDRLSYRPFKLTDQSGHVNVSFDIKHASVRDN